MAYKRFLCGVAAIGLAAACSPIETTADAAEDPSGAKSASSSPVAPPPASSRDADAVATMINTDGATVGSALFYEGTQGVVMRLAVEGLAPGVHGMHFHAIGTCDDDEAGFKATGGHVMPFGKPHGFMHPEGPHAGNLPNLIVGDDGSAVIELYSNLVTLTDGEAALMDADGSTLIIHENEDDHLTQPIGGAGGRIACGVVSAG